MDRPTIALVTDAVFPYHRGGKEIRYHEIAGRLAARADVHVYTMNWWRGPRSRREGDVTFHAISPLVPLYSGERRSVRQAVVFAAACLRLLTRRFDVIEADHMPYMQLFTLRLVASLRRKPLVVTWHEHWGPDYWREYLGPAGRVGWWLERLAMWLPDAIIAASPETGARLREQLGEDAPVTVAPNGVDLDLIRRVPAVADRRDLVTVGRLIGHKRLDLLVDAVALLRSHGMPVSCRIVGDGPERAALERRIEALDLGELVELRRDVDGREELYSLVKGARAFVFPSEREGFGIAALEALACGLPVVTTAAPDNLARHLVARSAHGTVCAPEAGALAEAVRDVLTAAPAGASDEAWLSEFDWESVTDCVAGVLSEARGEVVA